MKENKKRSWCCRRKQFILLSTEYLCCSCLCSVFHVQFDSFDIHSTFLLLSSLALGWRTSQNLRKVHQLFGSVVFICLFDWSLFENSSFQWTLFDAHDANKSIRGHVWFQTKRFALPCSGLVWFYFTLPCSLSLYCSTLFGLVLLRSALFCSALLCSVWYLSAQLSSVHFNSISCAFWWVYSCCFDYAFNNPFSNSNPYGLKIKISFTVESNFDFCLSICYITGMV